MDTKTRIEVRDLFASLYPEKSDARRILHDLEIDVRQVELTGSPRTLWHTVLEELTKHDKIPSLVVLAREEYPENLALQAIAAKLASQSLPSAAFSTSRSPHALTENQRDRASVLLARVVDQKVSVSVVVAEVLAFAGSAGLKELADFCMNELSGWPNLPEYSTEGKEFGVSHRIVKGYVSIDHEPNFSHPVFGGSIHKLLDVMRASEGFTEFSIVHRPSLSQTEALALQGDPVNSMVVLTFPARAFVPTTKLDADVKFFAPKAELIKILHAVRSIVARYLSNEIAI